MGILSSIMKPVVFAAKNLFRNSENVTAARKALYGTAKNGGVKKFESIFTNFTPKAKAGLKELAKEYKATSTKGFFKGIASSFKNIWKTVSTSAKAGVRAAGIKSAGKGASKLAKFLGGAKGIFKGLGKCAKKLPIIGTLITVGFEVPEIYKAFKDGGAWEGTKQILKSGSKLLVGAGLAALGTAVAGPVGGAIGWIIGDLAMDWLFPPYSEQHKDQEEQTEQNPNSGVETSETQTGRQDNTTTDTETPQTDATSGNTPSVSIPEIQSPIQTTPVTGGFGNMTNPMTFGGFGNMTSPMSFGGFGNITSPMTFGFNPYNFDMMSNPYSSGVNPFGETFPILSSGENIYLKYPSNYKFIYNN